MKSIRIPLVLASLSFGVMSFLLPIYTKAVDMNAVEIGGLFFYIFVSRITYETFAWQMGRS